MLPYIPPPDYTLCPRPHLESTSSVHGGDAELPRRSPFNEFEEERFRTAPRSDDEESRSERVRQMLWERGVQVLPTVLPAATRSAKLTSTCGTTPTESVDGNHKEDDEDWCCSRWSYGVTGVTRSDTPNNSSSASSNSSSASGSVSSPHLRKAALRKHLENHRNFDTLRSYRSCANCEICRQIVVFDEGSDEVVKESKDSFDKKPSGVSMSETPCQVDRRCSDADLLAQTQRLRCNEEVDRDEPLKKPSPSKKSTTAGMDSAVLVAVVRTRRHRRAKTPHELDVRRGHLFNVIDWCAESKWALCTERVASTLPPHSEFGAKPPRSSGVGFVRKKDVEVMGMDYLPKVVAR